MEQAVNTILIVDDEPEMRELHQLQLMDIGFNVKSAENGATAIEMLQDSSNKINAVLTDVVMPEMDGYELCEKIRQNESTAEIPVIFISSLESLEEKSKGYACGADEYVNKPLKPDDIAYKINNLIELRNRNKALNVQVMESQTATMQIMNFYGDLGQVLEFYKISMSAPDFEALTKQMFDVTMGYGLRCSIQMHVNNEILNFGDTGEISPLEANVIELARKKSRMFEFGARFVINYKTFSLLVKNLPLDNPDRVGTLKDSLGVLCNAFEARADSLLGEQIDMRKMEITDLVQEVLSQTRATFSDIESSNVKSIEGMMEEIEHAFYSLGLSDEQENLIRAVVEKCLANTNKAFEKGVMLNAMFDEIDTSLTEMSNIKK